MITIHENFEKIHFTESLLGCPEIDGRTIKIRVKGLLMMRGHPLSTPEFRPIEGTLVFREVASSVRSITEYLGDPKNPDGFKEEYSVQDFDPAPTDGCTSYSFEGVLEKPRAWVDWDIRAKSFDLIINEKNY